jgi:hypothetical protein
MDGDSRFYRCGGAMKRQTIFSVFWIVIIAFFALLIASKS